MSFIPITPDLREAYNTVITHPLQSYEWGEFREKTGVEVIRRGHLEKGKIVDGFQLTIHPIPRTNRTIGYLPKGNTPTESILEELRLIGLEKNCIFIQLEPNLIMNQEAGSMKHEEQNVKAFQSLIHDSKFMIQSSAHPLFTKYSFVMDISRSEEEILKAMHPKTRYNIKVAQKHNVEVVEVNTEEGFARYWELTEETTQRQKFYAHTKQYHRDQWDIFPHTFRKNELSSHLLTARVNKKILTTMLFFVFKDTLYYPYGASSNDERNTMHSVLTMWEGIRFGKKHDLKMFDMWGSLSENPDQSDPWYGFHRFKQGFGPDLVEFVGSYDLVINPMQYQFYKVADKLRWFYLKLKK